MALVYLSDAYKRIKYLRKDSIKKKRAFWCFKETVGINTGSGKVSGLLLYAKTTEKTEPFLSVTIGENPIEVRTLDLNQSFRMISASLDSIVTLHFGKRIHKVA